MADLELRQIVKRFGEVTVVQRLDLLVAAGEFVVLLGESGCGKSTTLRMVAGMTSSLETTFRGHGSRFPGAGATDLQRRVEGHRRPSKTTSSSKRPPRVATGAANIRCCYTAQPW
jgi:ABC-type Fe3+/spermidine/putrescine transport system ATPase subunit